MFASPSKLSFLHGKRGSSVFLCHLLIPCSERGKTSSREDGRFNGLDSVHTRDTLAWRTQQSLGGIDGTKGTTGTFAFHFHGISTAFEILKKYFRTGEMVQQLRLCIALTETPIQVSTPMLGNSQPPVTPQAHALKHTTYMHIIFFNEKKTAHPHILQTIRFATQGRIPR